MQCTPPTAFHCEPVTFSRLTQTHPHMCVSATRHTSTNTAFARQDLITSCHNLAVSLYSAILSLQCRRRCNRWCGHRSTGPVGFYLGMVCSTGPPHWSGDSNIMNHSPNHCWAWPYAPCRAIKVHTGCCAFSCIGVIFHMCNVQDILMPIRSYICLYRQCTYVHMYVLTAMYGKV